MKIKTGYFIAALLFLTTGNNKIEAQNKENNKPNIIYILVDDMGFGDLGVLFQNQRAKKNNRSEPWQYTPNLDRMASEGVLFTNQYCAAPVCAPSRASLLSGRSQGHASVRNNQFDKALDDNYTIASVLKTNGYTTAAFGKWGLQGGGEKDPDDHNWPAHPLKRGFDYFLGYIRHRDGHEHYPKEGVYRGKKEVWLNTTNITNNLDKCYTADLWTAGAKKWITEQVLDKKNIKPFFIYLAYDTPHAVLELPTQAYPKGGGFKGGIQWLGDPGHWINTASGKVDSYVYPEYADATWDNDKNSQTPEVAWPNVYKRYASSVKRIDEAVGDLIQLLKDLGIDSNTMIVFSSDNGPSEESYLGKGNYNNPSFFRSFGPFDGIKRDCWEGGIRMPVIARWPEHIQKGKLISAPSMLYDWVPTFVQMANSAAPAVMDGVSLLPLLTGKEKQQESTVYVEYALQGNSKTPDYKDFSPQHRGRIRGQMQMIRYGNFVGVRYNIKTSDDDFEIYDVTKDPQQTVNLAENNTMQELQKKMKAGVLQLRIRNTSAPRPYDDEPVPDVKPDRIKNGLEYKIFDGDYTWVPAVEELRQLKAGTTKNPDIKLLKKGQIIQYTGYLKIPETGKYTFAIKSGGKASLRIHKALVIDADYNYVPLNLKRGEMILKKGLHPFSLTCLLKKGDEKTMEFYWSEEGKTPEIIPENIFYRDN